MFDMLIQQLWLSVLQEVFLAISLQQWRTCHTTADMFVGQNTSSAFALSLHAAHVSTKQI